MKAEVYDHLVDTSNFSGQTIVVKLGGSAICDETNMVLLLNEVATMVKAGAKVAIVHGGGPDISMKLKESGKICRFVDGLRVTDEDVLSIAEEVLSSLNEKIVSCLEGAGVKAKGMSSIEHHPVLARKKWIMGTSGGKLDIGLVGEVASCDGEILSAIAADTVPVLYSLAPDASGQLYNINADHVATAVATALSADKLVYVSDVSGILLDVENGIVLPELPVSDIGIMIDSGVVRGGMIPKVRGCAAAIASGVKSVIICQVLSAGSLLVAVAKPGSSGTVITGSAAMKVAV